jgi:hypothetical protein
VVLALQAPGVTALSMNLTLDSAFGPDAVAALQRSAAQWSSRISDPITVNVTLGLGTLPDPVIGEATSVILQTHNTGFDVVRDRLVLDAADEPDDGVVAHLPTASGFTATLPTGFSLSGELGGTKANLKALGFTGLDATFGPSDGTVLFNSRFTYDYDRSDGVSPGAMDFETVAAHELGHILGFVSAVDSIDALLSRGLTGTVYPTTGDLFRFSAAAAPADALAFAAVSRDLTPGTEAVFSDVSHVYGLSTGAEEGDGHQASHFKDDALTLLTVGILDPTLAGGVSFDVTSADLRVLDVIGYEVVSAPLPPAAVLLASALVALPVVSRRRRGG